MAKRGCADVKVLELGNESAWNWAGGLHPITEARAAMDTPQLQVEELPQKGSQRPSVKKGQGQPPRLLWEGTFPPSLYLLNSCLAFNTRSVFTSSLTDTVSSNDPPSTVRTHIATPCSRNDKKPTTSLGRCGAIGTVDTFRAFSWTEVQRVLLGLTATSQREPLLDPIGPDFSERFSTRPPPGPQAREQMLTEFPTPQGRTPGMTRAPLKCLPERAQGCQKN